ncbi:MAG: AmmeMemoRadiSam system protein A [Deltaproteobacteria bacterium]|nr:AmmeMemoRadiSam system protein A [Deltaproteobacteria bacterium]
MDAVYLPVDSQKRLLELSRLALEDIVCGARRPVGRVDDPYLLSSTYGSFVTLYHGSELRGCVGTCTPRGPLYETVAEMTQAAAAGDHRFSPITAEEINEIQIDISILSPLQHAEDPLSLIVGEHGLHVSQGHKRGVLLPQVATEYGWDIRTFLGQVCLKADLPEDAWTSKDTRISSFTTLMIEEGK